MKKLVIIDGKSVFYRGYYAMGNLSKSDGTPTGGIYGFAVIALEIVKEIQPTKVVVAWDKAKTSIRKRKEIYSEYKAGRTKPPEDFFTQIPLLERLIKALGWSFLECDDYEADDIIGTLAYQTAVATSLADAMLAHDTENTAHSASPVASYQSEADALGLLPKDIDQWDTVIVSSDLDMLQIVDDNTRMYRLLKGFSELEEMDVVAIEDKYGIKKQQFLDLKALKGDASDNIPGVPGVGEKTAVQLLNQYGTLEDIYKHIDEIKGATQKKLIAGKDSAFMSKKLATIMTDAPVKLSDVPDLIVNPKRVENALKYLEFNSVLRKFIADINKIKENPLSDLKIMSDYEAEQELAKISAKQNSSKESVATDFADTASESDSIAQPPKKVYKAKDFVDYIVRDDIKKEMHINSNLAEEILSGKKKYWDLLQAQFLLNPLAHIQNEDTKQGLLNFGLTKEEEQENRNQAATQATNLSRLPKLEEVYYNYDLPLIPVLYKMEAKGIKISKSYFRDMQKEFQGEVGRLEKEIFNLAGQDFNVNSPIQLSDILFNKLSLPTKGIKKTARGYSTGAKELEKLKESHAIISKIMEYREASKLLSTYISPLPELVDGKDRIHTTFTQNVTATGRLSSVNPNLQNIPVRTDEGRRIRTGFIAENGKVFVSADYSQFELRLAAILSGDQALIDDFNSGIDIHTKTASDVFGVPMSEVTKTERRAAKVINFGVLYGMSVKGLADAAGMNLADAKNFIDDYFIVREPVKKYLEKTLEQARNKGFVETYYGRRRPTPDVKSSNYAIRQAAERAAMNMPIQGTEADLMKRAMIKVDSLLPEGADLVLQIHDSLVVECDDSQKEEVSKILQETMEGVAPELKIKLAVEVTTGKNWGEL
ncbi:DNA polymerase I [Candidatus Saccharibacteria bacterium]|nr:DNA polymerase I [Candidatus Saccharibacteria bacterium]